MKYTTKGRIVSVTALRHRSADRALAEKVYQCEIVTAIARGRNAAANGELKEHAQVMADFEKWLGE